MVAATSAGLSILLTMGVLGWTGHSLNMVTAALPSLLWVLSLSNGIHVLRRYQVWREGLDSPRSAMQHALADTARPCALSAVTTALGFLSLTSATMAPARELGIFAAAGMMISLLVNLSLGPAFALLIRVPPMRSRRGLLDSLSAFAAKLVEQHSRWIVGTSIIGVLLASYSLFQIRVESDPLAFLESDSKTVRDYQAVCAQLTGTYSLELVVETPGGWDNPDYAAALEGLARTLEAEPDVARVTSPLSVAALMNAIPTTLGPDMGSLRIGTQAPSVSSFERLAYAELAPLLASDGEAIRLSVLVSAMDSGRFMRILDAAEEALLGLPAPLSGYATGIVPRLVEAQLDLVRTQIRSFGLAFVVVFACIWLGLRSFKLMAVSVAPNLLPILAAFSAMAALSISLDAGTVMVASVALGIAVDDTVHLLEAFRVGLSRSLDSRRASLDAVRQVGPAMLLTTATACAGFFALGRSDFVPIAYFGILSGIALLVALAADLLLTPALLLAIRWKEAR
jgi:predicted RND superfamily exporter protein